jgi:hypothetical protein
MPALKHSSLLGPVLIYEENEVLEIRPQEVPQGYTQALPTNCETNQ